jgi:hypothetical protein
MKSKIAQQLTKLPTLSREQLQDLWRKIQGEAAPPGIRRELMIPFLAYKIQENEHQRLRSSARVELRRIARGLERHPGPDARIQPRIKPGTRLFRNWRGEMHEVAVSESCFEYRGTSYRSLSEIARKITGTRWSGPAFFGLNGIKRVRHHSDD